MKTHLPIIRNGKQQKIYEVQVNMNPLGNPRWEKKCFRYDLSSAVKYVKSMLGLRPEDDYIDAMPFSNVRKAKLHFQVTLPQDFVLESKHFRIICKVEYTTQILSVIDQI